MAAVNAEGLLGGGLQGVIAGKRWIVPVHYSKCGGIAAVKHSVVC